MTSNIEKFLPDLDGLDLSNTEKRQVLSTIWTLVESQIDQAFGLHPIQVCGKDHKRVFRHSSSTIESKHSKATKLFNGASKAK